MKPDRWRQIDALLGEALELESSRRADFLNEACAGDEELRNRIDALLSAHAQAESFIEVPALALAAEAVADETRSMVGRQLNHYHVSALVGAGGMGAVWKARDTKLDRDVAIKTFAEKLDPRRDPLARFEREAKLLASLNHPNIATIHGFEEDQGIRFLVLEFIDGETLDDRLRRGAIPLEESLRLARQISEALDAAHEKGVIHRDLKPANIKITGEGTVKVLDFGLAKALEVADSPLPNIEASDERTIVGTAAYMAPEQVLGRKLDKRADIWAFGVVLCEMVTGSRPFQGADSAETLSSVVTKEPDFERVPPSLRNLLHNCLEKDPKNRLRDIADAWGLVRDPSAAADAPHQQARRRDVLRWILASVLGAVAGMFSFRWLRPPAENLRPPLPEVFRYPIHAPPGSLLPRGIPAVSDDMLAYTVTDSRGVTRIYVHEWDSGDRKPLTNTENTVHAFWSPDGDSLAFALSGRLLRISRDGGPVQDLTVVSSGWQGTWNENDDILARAEKGLVRISALVGTPEAIPDSSSASFPTFLSDNNRFLMRVRHENGSSIQLGALDSVNWSMVVNDAFSAPILASTPLGKKYLLFVREGNLCAYEFDEALGEVLGKPVLWIPNIALVGNPAVRPAVGVSPSGKVMAYQKAPADMMAVGLAWVDRSRNQIRTLSPEQSVYVPRLSPDGSLVVGVRQSGSLDIWIIDTIKKQAEQKTLEDTADSFPVWSKDGSHVAYQRGNKGIYALNVVGSDEPELLTEIPGVPTSWSGQYLLYTYPRAPKGKIYLFDVVRRGNPKQVGFLNGNSAGGEFSPDGNYIAFDSDRSGSHEVYVQSITGGEPLQVSLTGGKLARWRAGGRELFFISPQNDLMAVEITIEDSISAGRAQKLFSLNRDVYSSRDGYDVSRDGQQFLILAPPNEVEPGSDKVDSPITVVVNWWVELEKKFAR